MYQVGVGYGEFAGEVALHVEVLVGGLDGLAHAGDVGDGGGGGNGHHVGVAHTLSFNFGAQAGPIQGLALVLVDVFFATVLANKAMESMGSMPWSHKEPLKVE